MAAPSPRPASAASAGDNPGVGALRVERVGLRTVVHTARAHSPLKLVLPKNHGDAAWCFVTSFGGGLVDGDALDLDARVGPNAKLLLATQASTKVYRATGRGASQRFSVDVGAGGLLVVLSDPVVCYEDAQYTQLWDVTLAADATLVVLDSLSAGRVARGERWAFAHYASSWRIARAGVPVLHDAQRLDRADGPLGPRLEPFDALATVMATGPLAAEVVGRIVALGNAAPNRDCVCSWAPFADAEVSAPTGAVGRIAARRLEDALALARGLLEPVSSAPLLGDSPFARKW